MAPHRDSLELASLVSSSLHENDERYANDSQSSRQSISSSRRMSLEREDPLDFEASNAAAAALTGRNRTYSVASSFDFAASLFPLSSTAGASGYAPLGRSAASGTAAHTGLGGGSLEKHKTLTYLNGLSLIIGIIIGSGIFSSPSQVSSKVGSPGAALVVWVVAGILAWTGAASYAELGGAIPLNGGAQVYLAKIFGEIFGFLFTWVAVLVLKPGSAAIVAIIMGEYLVRAFIGTEAETINPWVNKAVAMLGLALVTFVNCVSTKLGTWINDMLMLLNSGTANTDWKDHGWFDETNWDAASFALALYAGLWAYDGWDNTNYVVGEFRNPTRDLPRVIHSAMPMVILGYCLANIAYFFVIPMAELNATNTVAVMFGQKVFGRVGALVFALVVCASCFGALNSSAFTSSRLVYAAGKEGYIPALFGRIGIHGDKMPSSLSSQRTRGCLGKTVDRFFGDDEAGLFYTPVNALLLNMFLTAAYVVVGDFSTLLTFYGVAGYTFYFITVLGLIILRVKEPNLERPYKTWITTPIIFCCVSLFLLSRAVFAQPVQTVVVVAFVVGGVPVYFWRLHGRDQVTARKETRHGSETRKWWQFWKS
ncbi:Y+L amino acid transporter 2 [Ceratocystis platani]|uniref:Y+L amino acid transporter 2 n=1 Tax=Ceratocystis fimbriata f. sp. platani TaxID=88771 RepID=A0A0F8D012_CERFI|nr:Y+L amino acid transporter 2 [Ceratocystis platani]